MSEQTEQRTQPAALAIICGPLVSPILGRVISVLCARADLPVDRLSDAVLIGDAVSAHSAPLVRGTHLRVTIQADAGRLELRVGPLIAGGSERLLAAATIPGLGDVIGRLAGDVRSEHHEEDGDFLVIALD